MSKPVQRIQPGIQPNASRQLATAPRPNGYGPTLFALALLCALLALLILLIATPADLAAALHAARRDPSSLAPREIALLVLAGTIPLAAAIAGYVVAAQAVRLLRIWLYLGRLHAYVGRRLRSTATLYNRGLPPQVHPVNRDGQARGGPQAVQRLLGERAPVLLTGEPGSGKTAALLVLAYEQTRRRAVLPVFLARRRLPVLVPLAGYAADVHGVAGPQVAYLQRQVARYGSPGLAARLPRLLRSGRVLLLCDSLSDAPVGAQRRILEDLAVLPTSGRGPAVILAHTGALGDNAPEYVALEWQRWHMAPLADDDVIRRMQAAGQRKGSIMGGRREATRLREELAARRLERALRLPGLLVLTIALPAETPLPYGRAALLRKTLTIACTQSLQAPGDTADGEPLSAETLRQTLAALASSLIHADRHAVPLPAGARLGEALASWLGEHRPYSPLASIRSGPLAVSPEVAHACCLAGLRAGLLAVESDDSGLTFAHSLIEAGFAATWLADADDSTSPFDPGILRPGWALPVVLWAAMALDPGTITRRLLPLATAVQRAGTSGPGHAAALAEIAGGSPGTPRDARHTLATAAPVTATGRDGRGVAATIASLALGGITAALAPRVSAFQHEGRAAAPETQQEMARYERRLREVLDAVLELLTDGHDPIRPGGLGEALRAVEGLAGDELAADVAYLAAIPEFSRLARAQLVTVLGLLTSPLALAALVEHLADKDATLRSAVARGFALAGSRGVEALQQQLASPNEWVRARARESLDTIAESASAAELANRETARVRAVAALAAPEPSARVAAAETLGALQAHDAVDALAGRLADPDPEVSIAVLRALGRIADPAVLPVLREQVRHDDPAFRAALAETLGAYRDPVLIPDLALLLEDSASVVRAAAATALGVVGDPSAAELLLAHEADPDPRVGAAVASALRRLGQGDEGVAIRRTSAPRPPSWIDTPLPDVS